ncbi:hypothetical protein GCM10007049_09900 [Echinicola pacifica]|uniref:Outer membrane protein beta-barrel domain-containing protein n=2 Tax=Echinicola pacifica TaxID=346377 RepID=A0A918PRF7_9BACT|nr:hypothetical protein GCM10007049_09900 [Echinicola pacifica]
MLFASLPLLAQEAEEAETKNRVVFSLGYTWIPQGAKLSESETGDGFFVPAVGFDYFRKVSDRLEVGMMWDWELDHYIIRNSELERERAMIFAAVASYELMEHWAVYAGLGGEFEKNENLMIWRLGTEYAIPMGHNWEFLPSFTFDIKEGYNSWNLAVGFGKRF